MCVSNYQIDFNTIPTSGRRQTMPVCHFSQAEQTVTDNEIDQFLAKIITERSRLKEGEVISLIFVRPKMDSGKYCIIFNLKTLNESVTYRKFRMDTLDSAIKLEAVSCHQQICVMLITPYLYLRNIGNI